MGAAAEPSNDDACLSHLGRSDVDKRRVRMLASASTSCDSHSSPLHHRNWRAKALLERMTLTERSREMVDYDYATCINTSQQMHYLCSCIIHSPVFL